VVSNPSPSPFLSIRSLAISGSDGPYYCELAKAAGINLLHIGDPDSFQGSIKVGTSTYMTDDEFADFAAEADALIYPTNFPEFDELLSTTTSSKLLNLKAILSGEVYDHQGRGQNDWYEAGQSSSPSFLLSDFSYILLGKAVNKETGLSNLSFLRKMDETTVGDGGVCGEVDEVFTIKDGLACEELEAVMYPPGADDDDQIDAFVPLVTGGIVLSFFFVFFSSMVRKKKAKGKVMTMMAVDDMGEGGELVGIVLNER
jgi:hypothetical protein